MSPSVRKKKFTMDDERDVTVRSLQLRGREIVDHDIRQLEFNEK